VFFSSMLTTVQTTDLLEGIPKGCNNVLEWSKDNRIAILTKSGVYVLSLTPMAFSSSSSLNTIPEFYANPEDESDQAVQVGWMNKYLLILSKKGRLQFQNPGSQPKIHDFFNHQDFENDNIAVFATNGLILVTVNNKDKYLSIWTCQGGDLLSKCKIQEYISTCQVQKFGTTHIIFLSSVIGTVSTLKLDSDHKCLINYDVIWADEDRLVAKHFNISNDDNFVDKRSARLIFVKGNYVVISELDLSDPTLDKISTKYQQCVQIGNSNITDVQEYSKNEFIVVLENGPLHLLKIPNDLSNPCDYIILENDYDTTNYSCQAVQVSRNGVLWTCLQDGPLDLDHASKSRLVFLTNYNVPMLSDILFNDVKKELTNMADILELFRVLLMQSGASIDNFAKDNLDKIVKSEPCHFNYWFSVMISGLLMTSNCAQEAVDPWNQLIDQLSHKLLLNHAQNTLKDDPKVSRSLVQFIKDHSELLIYSGKCYEWNCKKCQGLPSANRPYTDMLECENGHKWPRCCRTLQVCDEPTLSQCQWCGSVALPEYRGHLCSLCTGQLQ
jgi:hypothetical protein